MFVQQSKRICVKEKCKEIEARISGSDSSSNIDPIAMIKMIRKKAAD